MRAHPLPVRLAQRALRAEPQRRNVAAGGRAALRCPDALPFNCAATPTAASTRRSCRRWLLRAMTVRSSRSSHGRPERAPRRPAPRSSSIRSPVARASSATRLSISAASARASQPLVRSTRCSRRGPRLPGALVDLGGDIAVVGTPPEGGPWLVSVESPWRPGESLGTIRLAAGGVATSGPTRRRFGPGGCTSPSDRPGDRRAGRPGAARGHRRRARSGRRGRPRDGARSLGRRRAST